MSKALVMIVDDEEGIRETLSGILEDEGYESITASSGESIKKAKEITLTLSCWMSGQDGRHSPSGTELTLLA
jgi:two-component system nitrogen regulation response regulator NtrX